MFIRSIEHDAERPTDPHYLVHSHGETTFALSSDTRKTKSEFENWEQGFIFHIR